MRPFLGSASAFWLLGLFFCLLSQQSLAAERQEIRLLFAGDILLSRNVEAEIARRKISPWSRLDDLFGRAALVVGNLEGAVGEREDCLPSRAEAPCFAISAALMPLLASAGFSALSIENNHSLDLGSKGRAATMEELRKQGLLALSFDNSPRFFHVRGVTLGIVAVNLVPGRNGAHQKIPSTQLRQKLRLAQNLANLVVVTVHWGSEFLDWPDRKQRDAAQWLIGHGADLIIGHHPHVVQDPEMISGKPVFFSLGNHLFDQKYPATRKGLIADCRINQRILKCREVFTQTPGNSFFPEIVEGSQHNLPPVQLRNPIQVSEVMLRPVTTAACSEGEISLEGISNGKPMWHTSPVRLVSIAAARLDGRNDYLFTLERHYSSIDGEMGLRPHVYSVTPQGLVARWRGSALAWPLLDAVVLPDNECVLCALHRGDSFVVLQPESKNIRVAAYRWNGFGFSGVHDPVLIDKCRECLEIVGENIDTHYRPKK